jgi:hypothetical protein
VSQAGAQVEPWNYGRGKIRVLTLDSPSYHQHPPSHNMGASSFPPPLPDGRRSDQMSTFRLQVRFHVRVSPEGVGSGKSFTGYPVLEIKSDLTCSIVSCSCWVGCQIREKSLIRRFISESSLVDTIDVCVLAIHQISLMRSIGTVIFLDKGMNFSEP